MDFTVMCKKSGFIKKKMEVFIRVECFNTHVETFQLESMKELIDFLKTNKIYITEILKLIFEIRKFESEILFLDKRF